MFKELKAVSQMLLASSFPTAFSFWPECCRVVAV